MPPLRHRRHPPRLHCHDYRQAGNYFFTLCTRRRVPLLGLLDGEGVTLTRLGHLVSQCWRQIEVLHPWILVDEFVIMPDHLHGLLRVWRGEIGSVFVAVIQFKGAVTKAAAREQHWNESFWQRGVYDAVVEGTESVSRVRRYIHSNPEKAARALGLLPDDRHRR